MDILAIAFAKKFADSVASEIVNFDYSICASAADTPKDVEWDDDGTTVTGTLTASADTMRHIYFVPRSNGENNYFDEYITVGLDDTYSWELFGNTNVMLSDLGSLAFKNNLKLTTENHGLAFEFE